MCNESYFCFQCGDPLPTQNSICPKCGSRIIQLNDSISTTDGLTGYRKREKVYYPNFRKGEFISTFLVSDDYEKTHSLHYVYQQVDRQNDRYAKIVSNTSAELQHICIESLESHNNISKRNRQLIQIDRWKVSKETRLKKEDIESLCAFFKKEHKFSLSFYASLVMHLRDDYGDVFVNIID